MEEQLAPAEHCQACGAVLAPEAEWCSLCFASTAPQHPAQSLPASVGELALDHVVVAAELVPPPPVFAGPPALEPVRVALAGPYGPGALHPDLTAEPPEPERPDLGASTAEQVVSAGASTLALLPATKVVPAWPCASCGHANAIEESACTECGAGFLSEATHRPKLLVPVVGDVFSLSKGQQIAVFGGAGVVLLLVLLAVMAVLGAVL